MNARDSPTTGVQAGALNDASYPFGPHSLDGPFICINDKEHYGGLCMSGEMVTMQGNKCSQCRNMKRATTDESLDLGSAFGPGDVDYDCVNKPIYGCTEAVYRAGAKCSKCIALNRPVDGRLALHPDSLYPQAGDQTPSQNADYDEGGPLVHNPNQPGDE